MRAAPLRTRHLVALFAFVFVPAAPGAAQSPAAAPPDCSAAEHRAFDFWVGDWNVHRPDGQLAGTNRIERVLGGCVLHERWQGAGGLEGESFNIYDRSTGRWHQTWVDASGSLLQLDGGLSDGRMVLESDADGDGPRQRITWTPNPDGSVRQLWESSDDDGATWTVVFDGLYRRR